MKFFLPLTILVLLSSCQAGNIGYLQIDKTISADFENCTVLPGYNYYYSGPDAQPDVILAVKKEYNFEQGLWKTILLDKEKLCEWIRIIDPLYRSTRDSYDGYIILSTKKVELGLWYSREDHAVIKEQKDRLIIYTPRDRQDLRKRRNLPTRW